MSVLFVVAALVAGALAVPWHPFQTALAAAIGGAVAALALAVRRRAGLAGTGPGRTPVPMAAASAIAWFGAGLATGLVLLAAIRLGLEPAVPAIGDRIAAAAALPVWRRLLIIYVAAVGEELLFRVLLLSGLVWVFGRVTQAGARPARAALVTATVLSALAFGAVHLPAWAAIAPGDAAVLVSVVALNALGGLMFGYAFVTRGILAAVCAHAGADCAIQFIGPMTG